MVRSRRVVASLALVLSLTGAAACGDDGGSDTTTREEVPRPSAPRLDTDTGKPAEEYPGAYEDARALCGISSRKKVAEILGIKSTDREAIARAVANDYKPRLKRQAYKGCLAGLK